jgi:hypothetical protein
MNFHFQTACLVFLVFVLMRTIFILGRLCIQGNPPSPHPQVIRSVLKRHLRLLQALHTQAAGFAVDQQRGGGLGRGGVQGQQGVDYGLREDVAAGGAFVAKDAVEQQVAGESGLFYA